MENPFIRLQMALGDEALQKLRNSHVAVFGIGGVGSYTAEALARAGVDPRQVWQQSAAIVEAALKDPCCDTNPMPVEDFMVRQVLEEVTGRV